jgi:hypothetical protein
MSTPVNLTELLKQGDSFVVKDYTGSEHTVEHVPVAVIAVIPADALFEVIEDAHKNNKKIAIYPVGKAIIDWT